MKKIADTGNEQNSFTFCVGPVHPALKEPLQFTFKIEGERVKKVDFMLSHVHRGIEWMGTRRNPIQIIYLAERICGICNISHPFAFCRAVESVAGIEVPPRAEYIRTINAELERIHSHLLWAGIAAHELGFDSVLHYILKARERVLDIIEYITGNRITKGIMMIGGVRRDISKKQYRKIIEAMEYYKKQVKKISDILLKDHVVKARTINTGILSKADAIKLCAVGPTARASGVKRDVRQDEPYAAYKYLDVEAITPATIGKETRGDVYDRTLVRLAEIRQSVNIIVECLKSMPEGKIAYEDKIPKLLAELKSVEGEGIGRHEAPRGEVLHYIKLIGNETLFSWKVRAPTYANLLSWVPMLLGAQIADIPIIAASTDPCLSCTNRAVITKHGKHVVIDHEALHELSVKKTLALRKVKHD
ncbi:MAG TPA: NADH dehydrogenase subunit [Candidatus Aenigmarchaeota archaeon]|nr:MAG: NADH dehydrogenase subunit [Candidatus Aenigmarchaeota archaeon]HDD46328.1 NADH dehydrogenase subunit [Candidatus Aenigmarchaeota archaeon]